MRKLLLCLFTLILILLALGFPDLSAAQSDPLQIPKSVQMEHKAIHAGLVEAMHQPGQVGSAAKALAEVLRYHFDREEEIALPPLGLLAPLADGLPVPEDQLTKALAMSDSLRHERPQMLGEHVKIGRAIDALRQAAKTEHAAKAEELADHVARHMENEEEVLYPAAILLGELIRARQRAG
jgi:Hemerythrin HHE cation binding domain